MFEIFRLQNAAKPRKKGGQGCAKLPAEIHGPYRVKVELHGASAQDIAILVSGCVVSVKSLCPKEDARPIVERYFRMPKDIQEDAILRSIEGDLLVIELYPKVTETETLED